MSVRILAIDDESAITKMVKLNLESMGNYEVRTENFGAQAVAAAKDFRPDLILLDVMMPDMDGDEISAQIMADPALSHIKIIFMTAIVTKSDTASMGSNIGGHEFLAKPVKTEDLIAAIERVLGG